MLVPLGSSSVIEVHDGTRTMADLPTKNFRKYVQRVWNTLDLIPHWSGDKPDMDAIGHLITTEGLWIPLPGPETLSGRRSLNLELRAVTAILAMESIILYA